MSGCARPGMKPRRCSGRCQMMRSGLSREVSIRKIGQQHEHVFWRAPQPLTAREVAELVLVAAKVDNPKKAAVADLTGSILSSLRNHVGKGIQRTNEGSPARWRLAAN